MKTKEEIREIINQCSFWDYKFNLEVDGRGAIYLQASYDEADVDTGVTEKQCTRRWFISPEMSKSEIVQTVFKCALTSMEHRTREWFKYKGRSVFGPHFNVDVLYEACGKEVDKRDGAK